MFWVALFSRCYWMIGTVGGAVIGQLIPFDLEGIDFCMTALFVIIFIDQWEKSTRHFPALLGIALAVVCLFIFGADRFMLPSLLLVSGILLLTNERREETP
jgi:4-azaleucine resistance transporter AzlC